MATRRHELHDYRATLKLPRAPEVYGYKTTRLHELQDYKANLRWPWAADVYDYKTTRLHKLPDYKLPRNRHETLTCMGVWLLDYETTRTT